MPKLSDLVSASPTTALQTIVSTAPLPGFLGYFGTGQWQTFQSSGTFTVPAGITQIRVRVVGGGGGGASTGSARGGGGGEYAHGTFNVSSGSPYTVTIGAGG